MHDGIQPNETLTEVSYYQVRGTPEDVRKLVWFKPGDGVRCGDWYYVPALELGTFWQAYRFHEDAAQVLSLVAHHPRHGFSIEADAPIAHLFTELTRIWPIDSQSSHFQLFVGLSRSRDVLYMRHSGPQVGLTPMSTSDELSDLLFPYGMGVECPADYSTAYENGWDWWVSYFDNVEQSQFQEAYNRLDLLHDWLIDASRRMYRSGFRSFKRALADAESNGTLARRPVAR